MISIASQIIFAWIYSHILEYHLHKNLLHNSKSKWFKFHFSTHHRKSRLFYMKDDKYRKERWRDWLYDDEVQGLSLLSALHSPLFFFLPYAYFTLVVSAIAYFILHRKAHLDHHWARKWLPHHYDHHMGKDQHSNWGVRSDLVDNIIGTRKVWKGSLREQMRYSKMKD